MMTVLFFIRDNMMSNTQYLPLGFTLIKPAHSTFNAFDSVHSTGDCAVGKIHGEKRNMHALVVENATDYADWTIVELSGKDSTGQMMFDSIAVYGAFDDMHAKIYATNTGAKLLGMFDSVAGDVVHSNQQGLQRALNTATGFNPKKPIPSWYIDKMQDVLSGEKVMWDSITLKSHGGRLDNLLLDMQRHDDNCALVEHFDSVEQVLAQYDDIEIMAYDGVFMTYSQLDKFAKRLHLAMDNASKASKVQVKNVEVSEPFKRQGMAQIAVMYTLDDGQSITVFLHNPDSTPAKMQANDVLIAWKWTLNGRDVTGAVQSTVHENGNTGANVNILAGRIMQLVEKNSARFKRTQAKKEQQKQELELAQQRVTEKQGMLDKLNQDIMMLQEQLDNLVGNNQQTNNNQTPIDDDFKSGTIDKFILKVRVLGETGDDDTLVNMNEFVSLNEAQAFIQQLYGNESNLPQQDDRYDEIHLAIHYTDKDGNKHFEQRWTTLDIKTSDGFFNPFKQTIANYLFNDLVHLGIDPNMVQGDLVDVQEETIIELIGDEFGYSDDMPIDELREKAINHLESMRDTWIDIPALSRVEQNTKVQIRERGIKHIKTFSPNPEKLLLLSKIEQVLKTAKYGYTEKNSKKSKKPDVELYHYLTNTFTYHGEELTFVLVIEKDTQGLLHYDILFDKYAKRHLEKVHQLLGNKNSQQSIPKNESGELSAIDYDDTLFDSINQDGYVLNLFIFDKDGNEIDGLIQESKANQWLENKLITLTGQEFGEFDLSTDDGKKALREKVKEYLDGLRGQSVYCPALNADVEIRKQSIKKFMSFTSNPVKLQIAHSILDIIKNGTVFKPSVESYSSSEKRNQTKYHYLKSPFKIDGIEYGARIVIREDVDGKFHYDLQVRDSVNVIFDSINKNTLESSNFHRVLACLGYDNYDNQYDSISQDNLFDSVSQKYVLNLFIFDKDGNEIDDLTQESIAEPPLIRSYDDKYVYTQDKQMRFYKSVNKFMVQKFDGVWGTVGRFDTMEELVKEYPQFTHYQQAVYENSLPDYDKSMFKLSEIDFDNNTFTLETENNLVNSSKVGTNKMLSTGFAIRFGKDDNTGGYQLIQLQLPETLSKDQIEVLEDYISDKGYSDFMASDLQGAVDVASQELLDLQDKVKEMEQQEPSQGVEPQEPVQENGELNQDKPYTIKHTGEFWRADFESFAIADKDKESLMRRADKYLELQHTQKSYHDIEGNEYKLKIVNIKSQDLSPMYELIPQKNGRTTTHMSVESADKEMQSINNRLLEQQQKQQAERDYENILSNAFPNVNKMQLGKIKKALEKTSTYNSDDISGTMTRKEFVEKAINVGYQPKYDDKVYARNPSEREAHEIAKEYTLYRESDGKVWNIIKAEYDYAMYLLNNRMGEDVNVLTDDKKITQVYSQADIDYLQSIIHKTIDLETVDMDKIIEIGEKNETDPLFEQALDVISAYEDEMTKDI